MNRPLIAVLAVLAAVTVRAASVSYTGAPRGVWEKAENWTPKGVPTAADDATIPSGEVARGKTHDAKLQPGGTRMIDPSAVFYEWTGL